MKIEYIDVMGFDFVLFVIILVIDLDLMLNNWWWIKFFKICEVWEVILFFCVRRFDS